MKITVDFPTAAGELLTKHAAELGYPDPADLLFELARNHCAEREDRLYTRMHHGEHNHVFGRSRREQEDFDRRERARIEEEERTRRQAAEEEERRRLEEQREREEESKREADAAAFARDAEQARLDGRKRALERIAAEAEEEAIAAAKAKK